MKNYLLFLLLTACLGSCKKDERRTGSLSFKADGVEHRYTGDWKLGTGCSIDPLFISSLGYFILAGVGTPGSDGFEAHLYAPQVAVGTYNNVTFEGFFSGLPYPVSSDCVVTITKIEEGRASGSFSGKMSPTTLPATVQITEGVFTDVPIR